MARSHHSTRSRVTMSDVARAAGVSRTTVSFVLNDGNHAGNVSEATKIRVREAAGELGYRPDALARALAAQSTDWYGLITEIVTSPFGSHLVQGAQNEAWRQHRFLLIASADGEETKARRAFEQRAAEKLLEQRVGGVLYAATWHRAVDVPDLLRELPTVLLNCFDAKGELPSIVPDEVSGGRHATECLIRAGHERIGYINLDPRIPAAVGRLRGWREAHLAAGLTPHEDLTVDGDGTADSGYEGARLLLDRSAPPTAIFCATDRMAMGAYDAIKERGLRIPHDIAVVGFDNQEVISGYLRPRLTTVALPFEEMGALGVRTLDAITSGQSTIAMQQMVDCPLLERCSV
ncbi:LacI family DNA-binding transcriptional regulator [Micropruina sp.]|uniref:LacI family DNA-binding transcriptional regulator n=1 Tax=Micropruina sp. TaxID=2737536 RepID=UPI0026180417|nr:LacI family DNA-binding transcriptional regulator [Micropruina sp.]